MVHVKSPESHAIRLLVTNPKTLQRKALDIQNEIRGTLKAFGLKVGKTQRLPSARAQVEGSTGGDSPRGIALLPRLK